MLTTGEQLRAARAMMRLEQRDLAERAGISPQTVQRLERVRGRFTDVRLGTLNALAAVFAGQGVTFGDGDRPSVAVELARVEAALAAKAPPVPEPEPAETAPAAVARERPQRRRNMAKPK